jgi:hypothetical protein
MSMRTPSDSLLWLIDHVRGLFDPIFKSFEHCMPTLFAQLEFRRVYNQWSGALSATSAISRFSLRVLTRRYRPNTTSS